MTKRRSPWHRADFRNAIVLSGEYLGGGPGCSCLCQLAIRSTKRATKFWIWAEEFLPMCVAELPGNASLRDVVRSIVADDERMAIVGTHPMDVDIKGIDEDVGQVLTLAWSAEESHRETALLLSNIPVVALKSLVARGDALSSLTYLEWGSFVSASLARHDVSLLQIPELQLENPTEADLARITMAYLHTIEVIGKANSEASSQERLEILSIPFSRNRALWGFLHPPSGNS